MKPAPYSPEQPELSPGQHTDSIQSEQLPDKIAAHQVTFNTLPHTLTSSPPVSGLPCFSSGKTVKPEGVFHANTSRLWNGGMQMVPRLVKHFRRSMRKEANASLENGYRDEDGDKHHPNPHTSGANQSSTIYAHTTRALDRTTVIGAAGVTPFSVPQLGYNVLPDQLTPTTPFTALEKPSRIYAP